MEEILLTSQSVFDFNDIQNLLPEYKYIRNKISRLVQNKYLIRLKQGVYLKNPEISGTNYSLEYLAQKLYRRSYVSLQYALQLYGMIPESVYEVTSVTDRANKVFDTSEGRFSYRLLKPEYYRVGVTQLRDPYGYIFDSATREKAMADLLYYENNFNSRSALYDYIINGLRIEEEDIAALNPDLLSKIAEAGKKRNLDYLTECVMDAGGSGPIIH
ncbi:MAG TPA: hypothetical protein PLL34_00825 [Candidatus Mcinerneyibacteriales bacterium]|nr:hypothetical protein [Candidatus Mcinerneyibacteriales bacterium]HPQ89912.1 hypothetical protein [Candidatus Mcinerneyibacteriales bacterium]